MELLQHMYTQQIARILAIGLAEFVIFNFYIRSFFDHRGGSRIRPIAVIVLCAIAITCVNIWGLPYVNTAVVFVLYFLFTQLLFRGQWVQKAKLCIIFIGLSAISEIGISFIAEPVMTLAWRFGFTLPDSATIPAVVSKLVLFALVLIVLRVFPQKYNLIQSSESPWLLIFPILGVANMYVILFVLQGQNAEQSTMLPLAAFGLMIPLSTLAPLLIYDSNMEKRRLESELKLAEERQQANAVFHREQERGLEDARRRAHDYKNHLINLRALYGRGSPEAEAYFDSLLDSLLTNGDPCRIEMGNSVVSNIIARVRRQCAANGIAFQLNIDCRDLRFLQLLDASAIFDNALDNALLACTELPQGRRRFINLDIMERMHFVVVRVKNSKGGPISERDGKLLSTKGGVAHGFGMENIRITARKYGGDVLYKYDDDTFTLSVRLNKGM